MASDYADQTAANALDENLQRVALEGYGILSGGEASATADPYSVTVTATTAYFAGETVTADARNIALGDLVEDEPKKVLLCVTESGTITVESGAAEPPDPSDAIRAAANRPAPPDLAGRTDVIPLWEVWVGANTTEIDDNDIFFDRRPSPSVHLYSVTVHEMDVESFIDGSGVAHDDEVADTDDIRTNDEIHTLAQDRVDAYDHLSLTEILGYINDQEQLTVDITGDAQTLRGEVPSDFADRVHNHDPRYLNNEPGTVTPENLDFDPVTEAEFTSRQDVVLVSGSATLTGGQNPAGVITETVDAPLGADLDVDYNVDTSGGFAGGFAFGTTESGWEQRWDPTAASGDGGYTIELTLSWTEDPGDGNDVPVTYDVLHENAIDF